MECGRKPKTRAHEFVPTPTRVSTPHGWLSRVYCVPHQRLHNRLQDPACKCTGTFQACMSCSMTCPCACSMLACLITQSTPPVSQHAKHDKSSHVCIWDTPWMHTQGGWLRPPCQSPSIRTCIQRVRRDAWACTAIRTKPICLITNTHRPSQKRKESTSSATPPCNKQPPPGLGRPGFGPLCQNKLP